MTPRDDDRRMSSVETKVALITQQQDNLAKAIDEVKGIVSGLDSKLDTFIRQIDREHSDAKETAAGRSVLRVTDANRVTLDGLITRVDKIEGWQDRFEGSIGTLKSVSYLASLLSAMAFIISILHAAHLL